MALHSERTKRQVVIDTVMADLVFHLALDEIVLVFVSLLLTLRGAHIPCWWASGHGGGRCLVTAHVPAPEIVIISRRYNNLLRQRLRYMVMRLLVHSMQSPGST